MPTRPPAIYDADDLWTEQQILDHCVPLHETREDFKITLYTIPNKLDCDIRTLKEKYPWITFGIHGWEHTFCEAMSWTDFQAEAILARCLGMGYDPLFKPPNWEFDEDLASACAKLGVVLHHHETVEPPSIPGLRAYPGPKKLRFFGPQYVSIHTHIQENPSTDFIGTHPMFLPEFVKNHSEFWTPLDVAIDVVSNVDPKKTNGEIH